MTKTNELEILDKAIRTLGTDSYLGPWLAEVRASVESDIRSDFFPQITLADAREQAANILAEANNAAADIFGKATAKAKAIEADADKHRDNIARAIHAAERELNRF